MAAYRGEAALRADGGHGVVVGFFRYQNSYRPRWVG